VLGSGEQNAKRLCFSLRSWFLTSRNLLHTSGSFQS
jgi:hypothetical protein